MMHTTHAHSRMVHHGVWGSDEEARGTASPHTPSRVANSHATMDLLCSVLHPC